MKKYLMTAATALVLGGLMTSCTKDTDFSGAEATQSITEKYEQIFVTAFGQPAPTQTWGFGENTVASTRAMTRTISVNGDSYDKFPSNDDVNSHFPESVPQGADELPTNGDYNYYFGNGAGHNYVISSAGTYTIGGSWQNIVYDAELNKGVPQPYNVYVSVEGDGEVIIKHSGSAMHNLYILKGNVKLDSSVGEMANVVITVAEGATLTDTREKLSARTELYGAIELYNKGTFYATNSTKYDMGNKARFYNGGRATITGPLTYSPADAENSFFMNFGDDAELTAPSMTLNSTGNFYNSGTTNITGETNVTQANIFWVNAGHYTTGTMTFSAKNTTFYNYCNLICLGKAHMYDGEFNLMDNSYTEAGSAEMDNFIVNMGSNTGMNIKGNLDLTIGQGDGTYQGFRTSGTNDFLRVAGTVTVAEHMYTLELTGDITYAFNNLVDLGANNTGVQPTYRFNAGTKEAQFDKLTVTPNTDSCGATWTTGGGGGGDTDPDVVRIIAEDLTWGSENGDFDFNDVIFDVQLIDNGSNIRITLLAAGGTLPLYIAGVEVHEKFGVSTSTMVNTYTDNNGNLIKDHNPVSFTIPNQDKKNFVLDANGNETYPPYGSTVKDVAWKLPVEVLKLLSNGNRGLVELTAPVGKAAAKVAVGNDYNDWCPERTSVDDKFFDQGLRKGKFSMYVKKEVPYAEDSSWYR